MNNDSAYNNNRLIKTNQIELLLFTYIIIDRHPLYIVPYVYNNSNTSCLSYFFIVMYSCMLKMCSRVYEIQRLVCRCSIQIFTVLLYF